MLKHGLGSKALEINYLNQYKNLNVNGFKVSSKPLIELPNSGGDFNYSSVTSATYSSIGVNVAVKVLLKHI